MTITRDYLLFGIDHKQSGAQTKMDKAIIDILDEIHTVTTSPPKA